MLDIIGNSVNMHKNCVRLRVAAHTISTCQTIHAYIPVDRTRKSPSFPPRRASTHCASENSKPKLHGRATSPSETLATEGAARNLRGLQKEKKQYQISFRFPPVDGTMVLSDLNIQCGPRETIAGKDVIRCKDEHCSIREQLSSDS